MKTDTGQCFTLKEDWAYFVNETPLKLNKKKESWEDRRIIVPKDAFLKPNYFKGTLVFAGTFLAGKTYFEFVRDGKLEDYKDDWGSVDKFRVAAKDMKEFIPYMELGRISGYFGWKKTGVDLFNLVYLGNEL